MFYINGIFKFKTPQYNINTHLDHNNCSAKYTVDMFEAWVPFESLKNSR